MGRHEFTYALMPHKGECCAPYPSALLGLRYGKTPVVWRPDENINKSNEIHMHSLEHGGTRSETWERQGEREGEGDREGGAGTGRESQRPAHHLSPVLYQRLCTLHPA